MLPSASPSDGRARRRRLAGWTLRHCSAGRARGGSETAAASFRDARACSSPTRCSARVEPREGPVEAQARRARLAWRERSEPYAGHQPRAKTALVSPGVVLLRTSLSGRSCLRLRPMAAWALAVTPRCGSRGPRRPSARECGAGHRLRLAEDNYRGITSAAGTRIAPQAGRLAGCSCSRRPDGRMRCCSVLRRSAQERPSAAGDRFRRWTRLAGPPDGDDHRVQHQLGSHPPAREGGPFPVRSRRPDSCACTGVCTGRAFPGTSDTVGDGAVRPGRSPSQRRMGGAAPRRDRAGWGRADRRRVPGGDGSRRHRWSTPGRGTLSTADG